ncbi:MAG: AAA family ATPase [Candidatus Yonathbacteria bacterium CG_4_10_14_3_um_filter_43_12]|nr:MAG: AAA family ATPase [Candidatus Yonathbacteria bacterium CG_4_10_14_3_um_filter_43_12]
MKIPRIYNDIEKYLYPNKVLVIFGPRRVGKTTLITDFLSTYKGKYRLESGDDIRAREILGSEDLSLLKEYATGYDLIVIDEAQRIPKIGWGLKLLVDHVPGIRIIATGSSSFELAGQVGEPLTGRKHTMTLFPLSEIELLAYYNNNSYDLSSKLAERLVFGGYPEVISAKNTLERKDALGEIVGSYLLKDIMELDRVRNTKILSDLVRLIAFQIGNEVSLTEIATTLGIDRKTVARYIDLLEKSFILYNLRGFSRNLRKEVTKKSKYYFYDIGVRNAIISNFNNLSERDDVGALWENFLVIERLKTRVYKNISANDYFWRTWDQNEVDFVEEREGKLFGYEFKWKKAKVKEPKNWRGTYAEATYGVITPENYLQILE